ncbi:GIY-YIG nuclease family protein [Christiangramia crocea]|uniref:GIY-YIG nuclease family protein n=1 Tax=Christiangramia crocea TaxID=2904124 RepID=A0A9X2A779_9FLAO|nr:GIY-YIG nuclease family protein [Gramella crocea]MCG9972989.1 GIY-YIG nuclease family protein [Gramella crocea]
MKEYFAYITTNIQKTMLYIGITNNLSRRVDQHFQESMNAKKSFAGKYNCYHLVFYEKFEISSEVILREKPIKNG